MPRWDTFKYIPLGKILTELKQEGVPISRDKFRRMEEEGYWLSGRTVGGWRRYTIVEAKVIKRIIKEYYGIHTDDS